MANELLSVPVAAGTLAIAAGGLGFICRKARQIIASDKLALMGILGAFIFAAQMVNIRLPAMPGTSGHMVGAVLLAIILGPHLGAIVISSVVIIQCLIFQDGGLLALGCNIINMALVPSYLGYFLYKTTTAGPFSSLRTYIGAVLALRDCHASVSGPGSDTGGTVGCIGGSVLNFPDNNARCPSSNRPRRGLDYRGGIRIRPTGQTRYCCRFSAG